ncbi:MAG: STAS domain-containing protein [Thermodesulfovibrionales bacterium]
MEIDTSKENNVRIVRLKGRMDAVTAPEFDRQFNSWLSEGENAFVINFSGLDYISSAGLRSILSASKQIKANGGRSLFTGLTGPVKEVFELSGFYAIFEMCDSEEVAMTRMK